MPIRKGIKIAESSPKVDESQLNNFWKQTKYKSFPTFSKNYQRIDLKQNGFVPLHSLGHGVGLNIHEEPFFGIVYDQPLKENMVVTIEPGVYKPGQFGIRIEDTLLVTKLGSQKLTRSPKEPTIIRV